jgi:hypothetical protein
MKNTRTNFQWLSQKPTTPLLTDVAQIERPEETFGELVGRLPAPKALLVNYALIQHDFPQLRAANLTRVYPPLAEMTPRARTALVHATIDAWLLDNAAFMSLPQAAQTHVNTPIEIGEERILAFRPPDYGRALVFSLEENARGSGQEPDMQGLLDVKGVGVGPGDTPGMQDHSNGLLELGTAILEVMYQQMIEGAFQHAEGQFDTLPIYGVIDCGFEIITPTGSKIPAGLLVRRAHVRQWFAGGFPASELEEDTMMAVETCLRRFGISSVCWGTTYSLWNSGDSTYIINHLQRDPECLSPERAQELKSVFQMNGKPATVQGINIQLTRALNHTYPQATLVDFTHYGVYDRFEHPIFSPDADGYMYRGRHLLLPDQPGYIQPDPAIAVPFEDWGEIAPIDHYPSSRGEKRVRSLCFGLAAQFAAGHITRQQLEQRLNAFIEPLRQKWARQPSKTSPSTTPAKSMAG